MTYNPKVLRAVFGDRLTAQDEEKLAAFERIRVQVAQVAAKRKVLNEKYVTDTKALNERLEEIRAQCTHPVTTVHYDPSGGGDSWRSCDVCDGEVK